jgi:Leucine-rich repeat (LRR) protein
MGSIHPGPNGESTSAKIVEVKALHRPEESSEEDDLDNKVCDEVWAMVLSFLPAVSLCRAAQISQQLARTARDPLLWRHVDLTPYGEAIDPPRLQLFLRLPHAHFIRHLSLSNCTKLKDEDIQIVAKSCPELESLDLSNCRKVRGACLEVLQTSCPNLKELNLRNCLKISNLVPIVCILRNVTQPFRLVLPLDLPSEGYLDSTSNFKSQKQASPSTAITFLNSTNFPVGVFWRNFQGELVQYFSPLQPGEHYSQQTYVTHPWEVVSMSDLRVVLYTVGLPQPHVAEIVDSPTLTNVPVPRGKLRSIQADYNQRVRATFRSQLSDPVKLYWLDYDGNEVEHPNVLAPNTTLVVDSFLSHAWRLKNDHTKEIALEVILSHQTEFVLKA